MAYGPVNVPGISGGETIIVAASDGSEEAKAAANYICNGTDDIAVIREAISALPEYGGKIVLSSGNFYIKATGSAVSMTVPDNTAIIGHGNSTRFLHGNPKSSRCYITFDASESKNVTLRDFSVDKQADASGFFYFGIQLGAYSSIININTPGNLDTAPITLNGSFSSMIGCTMPQCSLKIWNKVKNAVVANCHGLKNVECRPSSENSIIAGNVIESASGSGYRSVFQGSNGIFCNNCIRDTAAGDPGAYFPISFSGENNIFANNIIHANSPVGIVCGTNSKFINNIVEIESASEQEAVFAYTLSSSTFSGIYNCKDPEYVEIKNNMFIRMLSDADSALNGIYEVKTQASASSYTGCTVTDNICVPYKKE